MTKKPTNALALVGSITKEELDYIEEIIQDGDIAGTPMGLYVQLLLMDLRTTVETSKMVN